MFLSTILLALIVGALAGGGLPRLADLRLRWTVVLLVALALRLGAGFSRELGLAPDIPVGWAFIAAYGLIFAWLWQNWRVPGLQIAAVGIGANLLAILLNGGQMPIWAAAFSAAGFTEADIANDPFHFLLRADTVAEFVASGGLFGDVIPLPIPVIRDVVSIGDVILAIGIFWAIVYSMTRADAPSRGTYVIGGNPAIRPGAASATNVGVPYGEPTRIAPEMTRAEAADAGVRRQSPYLRLVRNRNFSLLWVGQVVSLIGERIHIIALPFLVLQETRSALEVGLTFAATAAPNLLLGPLAGALVDRWDRRITMIACDLLRAVLLLAVPFAIGIDVALVYLLAFLIATITLLFRPAKTAVIPSIVEERDLVTANSASSVADTAADLVGLPLAGVIVATLSGSLELAFLLGGATYVVSAILLAVMSTPRQDLLTSPFRPRAVWREVVEGFRFLRRQTELFSNTIVSAVAQVAVGAEIVATVPYTERVLDLTVGLADPEQVYALLLTAVALGSVFGGVAVGAIGERIPKGPMIISGFIGMGLTLVVAGMLTNPYLAIGVFFFTGLFNMVFIIPTITLFQQRTPQPLMGRVVSSRQALVFGAIALSMGLSGWLSDLIGADVVLMVAGAICALAGATGLLIPAMRNAR
ncbi:MAG TPA: MFS transporter [Candidatus Limnocylindrales bacterium]|nr:MFS transporter [Candidatus Limnocylindrales bacterium]